MKKFALCLAALALALAVTGCNDDEGSNGSAGTIKIAVAGPMTGNSSDVGKQLENAARMKIEEINAAGGIDGKKVEMVVFDDKSDNGEAASVARQIAADDSISIVIGHFNSRCTIAGRDEYNRKGIVEFTPASTNSTVCKGFEWTFRNLYRDDYQGPFLARYAKNALGWKKVAIFFDNDDYGGGLKDSIVEEAKKIGLETGEPIAYESGKTNDFKPLVEQIRDKGCDGVIVSGLYNEAALIAKVLRNDLHSDLVILGGDGLFDPAYVTLAEKAAEGTLITTPFVFSAANDSPEAKSFYETYKKKYEKEPGAWAALSYDAVGMALDAIKEVGADRRKIKDWLAGRTTAEKGYKGVTGLTYFDAEGDCPSKGATVAVVKDGKLDRAQKQLQP